MALIMVTPVTFTMTVPTMMRSTRFVRHELHLAATLLLNLLEIGAALALGVVPVAILGAAVGIFALGDPIFGALMISLTWLLCGLLLLVPPIGRAYLAVDPDYHARWPTDEEDRNLRPAWEEVCRRAGLKTSRARVMIAGHSEGAWAFGGKLILVSPGMLHLPPEQLQAVLAHELGHLRWSLSLIRPLAAWGAKPVTLMAQFGRICEYGSRRMFGIPRMLPWFLSLIASLALVGGWLLALSVYLVAMVTNGVLLAVRGFVSRRSEFTADRHAARLGYGPALARVLTWTERETATSQRALGRSSVYATHPRTARRLAALERASIDPR